MSSPPGVVERMAIWIDQQMEMDRAEGRISSLICGVLLSAGVDDRVQSG